jgi:serine/threonine protein phosphatase PrpC
MNFNYPARGDSRMGSTINHNQSKSITLKQDTKSFKNYTSNKNDYGANYNFTKKSDVDRINELRIIYNIQPKIPNDHQHERGISVPHNDFSKLKAIMNKNKKVQELTLNKSNNTPLTRNTMTAVPKKVKGSSPTKILIKPNSSIGNKSNLNNHKTKIDHLLMSYKNAPLNNPISINYDSFNTRVNYSNQVHQTRAKPSSGIKSNEKEDESNYNPSAKSVKEFVYKEDRNSECRNTMEDFGKIIDKFMNDNSKGLFCLYDGHGGTELAKYVRDRIPELLTRQLSERHLNVDKAITAAYHKVDEELKLMSESQNNGTTACIVYCCRENDPIMGSKRVIYCSNVGDTRAILVTNTEAIRLSYDHKCIDESEVARIRKIGGIVFGGRVFGQLAISRALGDHAMKKYGVVPTPHITRHVINEKDKFVVMASDGVWDVIEENEIFEFSKDLNTDELCDKIVKKAISNGSRDNISCIVIKLN